MQREKDYLKKKIDKLAVVLAELLAKVTKNEVAFTKDEFSNEFDQILEEQTTINLQTILEMGEENFLKNLQEKNEFTPKQLHVLTDVLYQYYLNFGNVNHLNKKIVALYESCITEGIALSLEQYKLIEKLKAM
ncbi:hypothetical protein [Bernardetia sp.]|uniref:hypothetical protein n=1 Tax=Bernardetia sp. TaxID=1937974 RepID=UPI0025C61565|nr:hypothetical protein [Bernardetia sp.]